MRGRIVRRRTRPVYNPPYSLPKREFNAKKIIFAIGVGGVLLILLYGLFFSGLFKISTIVVKGNTVTKTEQITAEINRSINSSIWGKNILMLNSGGLENTLAKQNFQFSSVKVKKHLFHEVEVIVEERKGTLLWQSNNVTYIIADDGRAIEEGSSGQKPNNLILVRDNSNLPVKLGEIVVPKEFIEFVRILNEKFPQTGLEISAMSVTETTNELYVEVSAGYQVNFDTNRSVEAQISDLIALLSTLKKQNKSPKQYIDLRISGRIFYQ